MFVTRSSVLSSRSLSFEPNFLSFEHNQDIQSNAKGIRQAKRQSNSFTLSPHISKNSFPLCFKQSNFIQFLSNRFSLVRLSFLTGAVPFLKPSQIELCFFFQKSVIYFGIELKGFLFPVKVLLFNGLHVSLSLRSFLFPVVLAHRLSPGLLLQEFSGHKQPFSLDPC